MTQQKTMAHKPYMVVSIASACLWIGLATPGISATADAEDRPTSLPYVWGKAFHIPPETTTEESGYFSLCEGRNGKILHHLVRHDPATGAIDDLGVLAVKNPGYAGDALPNHGFHTLPDGTLTPLHTCLAMVVARDSTIYVTVLSPFTLLKIDM